MTAVNGKGSLDHDRRKLLLPSLAAALLPFALLWLPPGHWRLAPLLAAAILTLVIAAVALRARWGLLPRWAPCALCFAYLVPVALLRASGGASGIAPMVLLPIFWLGLCGTWRQLLCLMVGVAVVFILPLIVVGGPDYPASAWRAAILFVAVSGLIAASLQALVAHARPQELERASLLDRLDRLAHTDAVTGLPNRRAWDLALGRGLAVAVRTTAPLTVALIDIDGLKAVNDDLGHPDGDSLLVSLARVWSTALRPEDALTRVGGDEFALLLPGCNDAEAANVIARLRGRVPGPHSCSFGLATWDCDESADELMSRADTALYEAKREGRGAASRGELAG